MYAIIEVGSKQLKVEINKKIFIEKINIDINKEFIFDKILCIINNDNGFFGNPYLKNANVIGVVEKQGLSKKKHIYKYKAKHNERKKIGHRQKYTCLMIKKINFDENK